MKKQPADQPERGEPLEDRKMVSARRLERRVVVRIDLHEQQPQQPVRAILDPQMHRLNSPPRERHAKQLRTLRRVEHRDRHLGARRSPASGRATRTCGASGPACRASSTVATVWCEGRRSRRKFSSPPRQASIAESRFLCENPPCPIGCARAALADRTDRHEKHRTPRRANLAGPRLADDHRHRGFGLRARLHARRDGPVRAGHPDHRGRLAAVRFPGRPLAAAALDRRAHDAPGRARPVGSAWATS